MLARSGVDELYRLSDFSGHIKESVGAQPDAVWPRGSAEVDGIDEFLRGSIQNFDGSSVSPRFADARIAVDRDISEASICGDHRLVTSNTLGCYCRCYDSGIYVDELQGIQPLVNNQQLRAGRGRKISRLAHYKRDSNSY